MLHFLIFLLTSAIGVSGCSKKEDETSTIRMGFTPAENTDTVSANGKVVATLLEKQTGYKFKSWVASDYTALVEAMRSGQIDIAWLAPFAFVLAEKHAGAHVMLKSVRHGQPSQYSAIVVKESSPFKSLEDLKGKRIAWTDPTSSSGHIAPKSVLISKGIDPQTFFKDQIFAGSHESLVMAVINGAVDAGATFSDDATGSTGAWTKYQSTLPAKSPKLRAIFVTPPMPSDTVSCSAKLFEVDPVKFQKIKEAILKLSETPEGKDALKKLYGIDSLVEAKSEEYEPLRSAASKLGISINGGK